ncbi:unnamed protein product [Pleuronectes platessa]|uniref:Uncharacterized protein n=1 Tax=Pleuronectes platessa TaxID=8262 RepID=A0A9N7YJT5_PLEPL|nr:unnamed protein product [Pleuronectes platessa]
MSEATVTSITCSIPGVVVSLSRQSADSQLTSTRSEAFFCTITPPCGTFTDSADSWKLLELRGPEVKIIEQLRRQGHRTLNIKKVVFSLYKTISRETENQSSV